MRGGVVLFDVTNGVVKLEQVNGEDGWDIRTWIRARTTWYG